MVLIRSPRIAHLLIACCVALLQWLPLPRGLRAMLLGLSSYAALSSRRYQRSDEALRHSQANLRATFDSSLQSIVMIDRNRQIQVFNRLADRNARRVWGHGLREGASIYDFVAPRDRATFDTHFAAALDGQVVLLEKNIAGHDGSDNWFEFSYSPITTDEDEVIGVCFTSADVSMRKRTEARLRLLERAIHASSNGIVITDPRLPDNPVIFVNRGFEAITGYKADEVIGHNCRFLQGLDAKQDALEVLRKAVRSQLPTHVILKNYRKDGTPFWNELRIAPVPDEQGQVSHFIGVQVDVTARRQAEEQLQEQRDFALQVMNTMGEGLTVSDLDLRFEYVNPAFAAMVGYSPDELIGKTPFDLVVAEDQPLVETSREFRREGQADVYSSRIRRADGSLFYAQINAVPRYHGNTVIGSVAVLTDLTEQKQIEALLERTRDQAIEASRLKSEFLATISHEIRTPMNGIIGMAELLSDTPLNAEQQEYTRIISDSAQLLLAIINDILDFSKIEAGKLRLDEQDFAPHDVVAGVVDLLRPRARSKGLHFDVQIAPGVPRLLYGDPLRLRQVLLNLVDNAIKFTDHGSVSVRVNSEPPGIPAGDSLQPMRLQFTIQDTGIGLSEAAQRRLFQPFTQIDGANNRRYGGTGLGLMISLRLVELMGGTITVTSSEGQGATFQFSVWVGAARNQSPAPASSTVTAGGVSRPELPPMVEATNTTIPWAADPAAALPVVLLAEDNRANQRLTTLQLERLGCTVEVANNGGDVVRKLQADPERYSLILMDCQMPEVDGFAATRRIRALEHGERHIPIIALTANSLPGDREQCLDAGMDDFISKPVQQAMLRQILDTWLSVGQSLGSPFILAGPVAGASTPLLDHNMLAALRSLDDGACLIELIDLYLQDTGPQIGVLQQASLKGDLTLAQQTAHQIKGSSASIGAARLAALCADLEHCCRQGALEQVVTLADQIGDEFQQVAVQLHAAI